MSGVSTSHSLNVTHDKFYPSSLSPCCKQQKLPLQISLVTTSIYKCDCKVDFIKNAVLKGAPTAVCQVEFRLRIGTDWISHLKAQAPNVIGVQVCSETWNRDTPARFCLPVNNYTACICHCLCVWPLPLTLILWIYFLLTSRASTSSYKITLTTSFNVCTDTVYKITLTTSFNVCTDTVYKITLTTSFNVCTDTGVQPSFMWFLVDHFNQLSSGELACS